MSCRFFRQTGQCPYIA
ncbi:hypothetical protein EXW72_22255 [Pseudomonas sp. BCA14]|nr:hypothetical protein EXW70_24325 [Pseudomonas sp. JMN1]TFF05530.1 hypothetical protein EXW71_25015 [Pseudomonas sp. BCA17]TFF21196.1 hypothetical protein EXW72_22255 [Pseudomonas sp. BCA14]TFF21415.1 hypothetical protein EXW73_22555 [Pseudomonas sp. BCA13]